MSQQNINELLSWNCIQARPQLITRMRRLAIVRSLLIAFPARATLGLSDEMETYESHGLHPQ